MRKGKSTMDKIFGLIKFTLVACLIMVATTRAGFIASHQKEEMPKFENSAAVPHLDYDLDKEVLDAMDIAEHASEKYASEEIDKWIAELMKRTDVFLDDYFSFTNVKTRETKAVYHCFLHKFINEDHPSASTVARRDLEKQISKQVIKKEIAQQKVENITNQALVVYMDALDKEFVKIQKKHNIPTPVWNKYLSRLCNLTAEYETRSIPISVKLLWASSGVLTVKAIPVITKIGQKAGQKLAVKAGSKAVSSLGAKSIGKILPGAGMCISTVVIVWDLYDYKRTADNGRKQLRAGFRDYFKEMKTELMGRTEDGIMGSIVTWENNLKEQISKNKQLALK